MRESKQTAPMLTLIRVTRPSELTRNRFRAYKFFFFFFNSSCYFLMIIWSCLFLGILPSRSLIFPVRVSESKSDLSRLFASFFLIGFLGLQTFASFLQFLAGQAELVFFPTLYRLATAESTGHSQWGGQFSG